MKHIFLSAAVLLLASCMDNTSNAATPNEINKTSIKTTLEPFFGSIENENITSTGFDGVVEVLVTNPITTLFVSSDGKYLIEGDIIDLQKRAQMPESSRVQQLKKSLITEIKDSDKIIFKATNEKHIINVFTDVDCPFCAKLHAEVGKLNELGVTVKYLASPLESLHPQAQSQMEKIWCAPDKAKAMDDYKTKRIIPDSPKCDNPVASQLAVAQKLGVNGTPAVFLENGEQIAGYMPADRLLQRIENSKK